MPIYYSIQVTKILGDCNACADSEYQAAFGGLESRLLTGLASFCNQWKSSEK